MDGKVYSSTTSGDGRQIELAVGGSSAACYATAMPVVIHPEQPSPIVLAPDERGKDTAYFTSDVWWNGNEIVTSGLFLDNSRGAPCATGHDARRFDLNGQLEAINTGHITQYRPLGQDCDHALVVKTVGPERSSGSPTQVYAVNGEAHKIRGFNSILWSAPRTKRCGTLPGLPRLN